MNMGEKTPNNVWTNDEIYYDIYMSLYDTKTLLPLSNWTSKYWVIM